jgi:hypothetical protein
MFNATTGLSAFLNLNIITPTAPGALQWYCTWNTTPASVPLPYFNNFGIAGVGPLIIPMTPVLVAASPELDIREIAVHNTRGEPVQIGIDFSNGVAPPAPTFRLISCGLGADHTLTYNAMPLTGGAGWKIFDGQGHLISQSS